MFFIDIYSPKGCICWFKTLYKTVQNENEYLQSVVSILLLLMPYLFIHAKPNPAQKHSLNVNDSLRKKKIYLSILYTRIEQYDFYCYFLWLVASYHFIFSDLVCKNNSTKITFDKFYNKYK